MYYYDLKQNKLLLTVLALIISISTFCVEDANAQDSGPTNYCIPSNSYVPLNQQWGMGENGWCYPEYITAYGWGYRNYYTSPILEAQIIDAASGEIKMDRESREDVHPYNGPWEGCYVYTGVKGEMEPGGTFKVKTWNDFNYYSYGSTDYCSDFAYGWYTYMRYFHRIFIDFNMDGDFEDPNEWINSPDRVANGMTTKSDGTYDWQFWDNSCHSNYPMEYQFTVPDDQPNGITRMRIMNTLGYYWDPTATPGTLLGQGGNSCWNGYIFDYSEYGYPPGSYYGYNYGEIEDYLIEFTVAIKGSFPDNKAPNDILLAGETYDGKDANFERAYVKFGQPQKSGTLMTYQIIGPLPSTDVVYEGLDPETGSNQINIGEDKIGTDVRYNIQKAQGSAVVGSYGFKRNSGGEYQLIIGIKKPSQADFKSIKKNFSVSWEWDLAAVDITRPLPNGSPRYFKYPRGLNMDLQGVIQNVGLRGLTKFDAYYKIYNSKGELQVTRVINWDTANFGTICCNSKTKSTIGFWYMEN